ncbi:nucleotidyltransferase [Virgibacillus sp. LDC-1]|uniref:nucleotidyltransferase n=1 Tax=Virgibacillus sp. LDC-1 TaxID=3039856 RepID=UPI0024DE2C4F|nr:nucleotidyltransferase [Virgibacillus sp. LDC-1]
MRACGLVVEYNPFHNGHLYHLQQAKKTTDADIMIAVMSGSFLQRGEPAIIDKFHRVQAALKSGIDIVLELPYAFSVQSSELFAKGSIQTLSKIGVDSVCFGSESGDIHDFLTSYQLLKNKLNTYKALLHENLNKGLSFPEASKIAYEHIGLTKDFDLSKPNNILGFSYVKEILEQHLPIKPVTIKRIKNNYHDVDISDTIASATSIRSELLVKQSQLNDLAQTMPSPTFEVLQAYKDKASQWHQWEAYFPFLQYRVLTMGSKELALIEGVIEGLEYRIYKTAKKASSFHEWVQLIKSKRYTWTRIQRIFVHILTNTKKAEIASLNLMERIPYVRLLGMSPSGQHYLNIKKKQMDVPIVTKLSRSMHPMLQIEERATHAYYSILSSAQKQELFRKELSAPIQA